MMMMMIITLTVLVGESLRQTVSPLWPLKNFFWLYDKRIKNLVEACGRREQNPNKTGSKGDSEVVKRIHPLHKSSINPFG